MRGAVGPSPAADEAQCRAVDEAGQALHVAGTVQRDVMVHRDLAVREPARRAA